MASQIILKKSSVAAKVPAAADLVYGELALNYTDGKLYYKTNTDAVAVLNAGTGTVTSVVAGTGLSGGTITGTGTIAIDSTVATLTGTQTLTNKTLTSPVISNGTASGVTYLNASKVLTTSSELILDTSGNLGVGTTTPGAKLHVSGATATGGFGAILSNTNATGFASLEFSDGTVTKGQIWAGNASYATYGGAGSLNYTANSGPHVWYNNYVERMRLDAAGNLSIGTNTSTGKLSISGISTGSTLVAATFANTGLTSGSTVRVNFLSGEDGTVGRTRAIIEALAPAANDGALVFSVRSAGTTAERMRIGATGNVTVTGTLAATNVSGTNTGDQTIPTTLPNPNAITFTSTGGAVAGSTYTGAAVLTVDYATVGAAAAAHTHSYLPLSGGTLTGTLGLAGTSGNSFAAGTGDGATSTIYNFMLSGWNGMAFYNGSSGGAFPNAVSGVLDFRNGVLNMLGGLKVNGTSVLLATAGAASGLTLNDGYTEEVFALSGTAPALSPNNGSIQTWTLTANSTPTAGTWASGQSITLMIDDGTAYSIIWTSLPVTWVTGNGTAPTLALTGYTSVVLWKVGTVIYGARVGNA